MDSLRRRVALAGRLAVNSSTSSDSSPSRPVTSYSDTNLRQVCCEFLKPNMFLIKEISTAKIDLNERYAQ